MKLTISKVEMNFSAFSITLYFALMIVLVSLGFWQLDRAEQKKIFLEEQKVSAAQPLLNLTADAELKLIRYRTTELTGYYDPEHQFLIDNQIVNGQVGYFVMTPFKIKAIEQWILVNRGWVPLNKNRRILPKVSFENSPQHISGRINSFPVVGFRLAGAEIPTEGWPSVVQVVESSVLAKKLGYTLLPFQIELDKNVENGYFRDWKKKTVMPPEKHVAYAVQWFGLALTLTVLFLRFSRKNK